MVYRIVLVLVFIGSVCPSGAAAKEYVVPVVDPRVGGGWETNYSIMRDCYNRAMTAYPKAKWQNPTPSWAGVGVSWHKVGTTTVLDDIGNKFRCEYGIESFGKASRYYLLSQRVN